jgi:hypothetical protein
MPLNLYPSAKSAAAQEDPSAVDRVGREELAASLYRLMFELTGGGAGEVRPQGWEGLSVEEQVFWYELAKKGPAALEALEGQPLAKCACAVAAAACEAPDAQTAEAAFLNMAPLLRLAWEGVARFLAILMDADESATAEEAHAVVTDWFKRKVRSAP